MQPLRLRSGQARAAVTTRIVVVEVPQGLKPAGSWRRFDAGLEGLLHPRFSFQVLFIARSCLIHLGRRTAASAPLRADESGCRHMIVVVEVPQGLKPAIRGAALTQAWKACSTVRVHLTFSE
jgi:hypothetical protein